MVCYVILTDVSLNEQSQLLVARKWFPSSSQASHLTCIKKWSIVTVVTQRFSRICKQKNKSLLFCYALRGFSGNLTKDVYFWKKLIIVMPDFL